jgi:hypothetical protein
MALNIRLFESAHCSRCGGSGRYSYTWEWADTCFKCAIRKGMPGSGFTLTKLGVKAREAWLAANSDEVTAADIKVGDIVLFSERRAIVREVKVAEPGENFGWSSSGVEGTEGYVKRVHTMMLVTGSETMPHFRPMEPDFPVTRWTRRVDLPPEAEPGTDRKAEMKAYIAAAEAAKGLEVAA